MKKLNLGCGNFKKEGYINLDWVKSVKPNVIHDLNSIPYPFKNNYFDLIEGDHILEHLKSPFKILIELHRILKNNGKLIIKIPHFSRGFTHPEHNTGFGISLPNYFNRSFQGGYMGVEFKLIKMKLNWSAQPYLKKQLYSRPVFYSLQFFKVIINFFANLSPNLCSRIWCYWVGGFEETTFEFQCIKNE